MYFKNIIFPIYIDYSSTTPVDPRILEKLLPYFYYKFGNYNSKNHIFGWNSNYSIEICRKNISKILNCDSRELIFTSNSTESINICLKGFCNFYKNKGKNILTISIEHKSILNVLKSIKNLGFSIDYLNLKPNGLINFKNFKNYFKNNLILIVISHVNSEIGIIQNLEYISFYCKLKKLILFVDCSQSIGKILIDLKILKIDILVISSHKIYGPKGCSLVYIRRKSNLYFKTIIDGGGQEKNIRSGTLNNSSIIGFYESLKVLKIFNFFENLKYKNFKNLFFKEIIKIELLKLNGDFKYRIPTNLNLNLNLLKEEYIIQLSKIIAFSQTSSCLKTYSYITKIFNLNKNEKSIRFVFGRFNKISDIYILIKLIFLKIFNLKLIKF